ncbi:MAG: metalloregulator ArsR/SmtB family transcription factor [Actinomycetota bacterium]|nr:metalloregulator ArsR/SmtB family transcription factor [Actinomycetota bacterium]
MTTQAVAEPEDTQFGFAVETFKLLSDDTRLRILWALLHGEHSVGELATHVGVNVPAVSQHLAKLRLTHLVKVRRDGNKVFYAAENAHVLRLVEEALFHSDHVVLAVPDHHGDEPSSPVQRTRRRA